MAYRITKGESAMDFSRFSALTFDCYGTLIDWEAGILSALRPWLESNGWSGTDEEALEFFGSVESGLQAGAYLTYEEVLRQVAREIGSSLGFSVGEADGDVLAASVADWPAFPDTAEALRQLKGRYRLAVVSNIDDDLFALSNRWLGVEWDEVVTAQQVRSYKPAPAHFHEVLARLGLPRESVLHVAQSLFHDIVPARKLGITTAWVNRRKDRQGFGATPAAEAVPDVEVPDLATLARLTAEV